MSTRPPPLQPFERPPTYRMVTRMYSNSLRPIVIVVGSIIAIWCLICAIPAFQDINEDKENGQPKFAIFDIVLGSIYAAACAIEVFGVVAAASQRAALVRIYALLSVVASLCIVGAGFLRVVIHFVYKDGLISECEKVVQGEGVEFRFGIWGPRVRDRLDPEQATQFCRSGWSRDSLNEIVTLIFEIIFAIFYVVIAFAYYHQIVDPTSVVNVTRVPVGGIAGGAYPDHYNRPYDSEGAPYDAYRAGAQPSYAPPPGPPPTDMGYGVGAGDAKDKGFKDDDSEITKFDDPFADFDGPSKSSPPHGSGTPPAH